MKQTPDKTFNILLFGETGGGKSTTINALANYLKYNSFDDALSSTGELTQVIPSKFTLLDPETYEDLVIQHGDQDENELHNDQGNSVTQSPKSYSFDFKGKTLRIIDTPGMGDTGGIEVDKRNFKNILEHLKTFETLHGICFLIKTNTTRKTAFFSYCLNKLLTTLHRSACANIIFCFTFSRNSLYGPGDGHQTLKSFLASNELQLNSIELKTGINCFYIDNEAFRYLCARKHNYPFAEDREEMYRESWDKSVEQSQKMLDRITSIAPHNLRDTFMIVKARNLLPLLEKPFNDLKTKIKSLDIDCENEKNCLGSLNNKNNLDEFQNVTKSVKSILEQIKENVFELEYIENFILKLSEFVILNSNTRCEKLVEPYLDILLKEGALIRSLYNENRENFYSQTKKRKISVETASLSSEAKFQMYLELIEIKSINEIVSVDKIENLTKELLMLKYCEIYFVKNLGVEKPVEKLIENTKTSNAILAINSSVMQNGKSKTVNTNKISTNFKTFPESNISPSSTSSPLKENLQIEWILSSIGLGERVAVPNELKLIQQIPVGPNPVKSPLNESISDQKDSKAPTYASVIKPLPLNNQQITSKSIPENKNNAKSLKTQNGNENASILKTQNDFKPTESNWTRTSSANKTIQMNNLNNYSNNIPKASNSSKHKEKIQTKASTSKVDTKKVLKNNSKKFDASMHARKDIVIPATQNRFSSLINASQQSLHTIEYEEGKSENETANKTSKKSKGPMSVLRNRKQTQSKRNSQTGEHQVHHNESEQIVNINKKKNMFQKVISLAQRYSLFK